MSAGTVPVVILGRYVTLAGGDPLTTAPFVAADYSAIELAVWRGPMEDGGAVFEFKLEESMDRVTWTTIDTATVPSGVEVHMTADLSRTWLRAEVRMTATAFAVASCYAVGFLIRRR